jgi:hypothetical protein
MLKTGTTSNFATPVRKNAWFAFLLHAPLDYFVDIELFI